MEEKKQTFNYTDPYIETETRMQSLNGKSLIYYSLRLSNSETLL